MSRIQSRSTYLRNVCALGARFAAIVGALTDAREQSMQKTTFLIWRMTRAVG